MATVETKPATCAVFPPITWSKKDTDQTIVEVKGHNAAWKSYCAQSPKKQPTGHVLGWLFRRPV